MADNAHGDDHHAGDHDHSDHQGADDEGRVTSPMQEFSPSQVGTGLVVFVVGLVVTFGIPFLLG